MATAAAGVGYRASTSLTFIVRTLFGSKPVSPYLRASRLWIITPAPINNTSDSATSHTISKRRVPTPIALLLRPPSLSASLRSDRPARTAGSVPASMPVSIDTPTANSSTRPSIEISSALGTWLASSVEADVSVPYASRSPSAPPAPASSKASVNSCRNTRPRPAPSAERIAISLRRLRARVNSRLPTLAQAMRRTNPTAPSRMRSIVRLLPTISSCIGMTTASQPRPSVWGNSRASRAEIASISACACASSTSRFRRATPYRL